MPSLRLTAPGHPPTVYNLHKKITSIGSSRDNDVVLPDPLVTDGYAIHFDGQTYTVCPGRTSTARWRSQWSASTRSVIASTRGTALGSTHGS
jgi:hypothetical protein